jgi:hypothetical protein
MKSKPRFARRLLCGVLVALCATSALPETPDLYTVEIVVFRNGSDIGALPDGVAPPAGDQTQDAAPVPAATGDGVDATPVATSKLNTAAARLAGKAGLTVLAHVAWTQSPTAWNSRLGASAAQLGLGNDITGKVFLERGQYLHLGLDLTVNIDGHLYRMDEVRRVKPNEIHYFDRPAVGVLAIVTTS